MTPLRLSQGHLNLLSTCPRKFQHLFLDQLNAPNTPEQQEKQDQGTRFHMLLQQWQLGLDVEPLVQEDPQLQGWFEAFMAESSTILKLDSADDETLRQSEHERTLDFQGYLLTVRYDLLISNGQQAKILDWKTYPRPQSDRWLQQNWQTRLYPFVLAETSSYDPEQIAIAYWFFQTQAGETKEPKTFSFRYSHSQHDQTRQDMTRLLDQLTTWLQHYQTGEPFPKVALGYRQCEDCSFAVRCDRAVIQEGDRKPSPLEQPAIADRNVPLPQSDRILPESLPNLVDIEEIPI